MGTISIELTNLTSKLFSDINQSIGLPEACNFIEKEILAQVFPCKFCEILKNTFLTDHLRETASDTFYYLLNSKPIPVNRSSFKILIHGVFRV